MCVWVFILNVWFEIFFSHFALVSFIVGVWICIFVLYLTIFVNETGRLVIIIQMLLNPLIDPNIFLMFSSNKSECPCAFYLIMYSLSQILNIHSINYDVVTVPVRAFYSWGCNMCVHCKSFNNLYILTNFTELRCRKCNFISFLFFFLFFVTTDFPLHMQ